MICGPWQLLADSFPSCTLVIIHKYLLSWQHIKGRPGEAGFCILPLKQFCVPINKRAKRRSKPKRNPPFSFFTGAVGKAGSAWSDIPLRAARYCHNLFWFINDMIGFRSTRPTKSITYSCGKGGFRLVRYTSQNRPVLS